VQNVAEQLELVHIFQIQERPAVLVHNQILQRSLADQWLDLDDAPITQLFLAFDLAQRQIIVNSSFCSLGHCSKAFLESSLAVTRRALLHFLEISPPPRSGGGGSANTLVLGREAADKKKHTKKSISLCYVEQGKP
jgi:hypothetical protein